MSRIMTLIGPDQAGKTRFVQKLLACIDSDNTVSVVDSQLNELCDFESLSTGEIPHTAEQLELMLYAHEDAARFMWDRCVNEVKDHDLVICTTGAIDLEVRWSRLHHKAAKLAMATGARFNAPHSSEYLDNLRRVQKTDSFIMPFSVPIPMSGNVSAVCVDHALGSLSALSDVQKIRMALDLLPPNMPDASSIPNHFPYTD